MNLLDDIEGRPILYGSWHEEPPVGLREEVVVLSPNERDLLVQAVRAYAEDLAGEQVGALTQLLQEPAA